MEQSKITVAIVIPCRNEFEFIEDCVLSIVHQNYPTALLNVFVVDGMSEDGTIEVLNKLTSKYSNVHLIINEAKVTPIAMNLGLISSNADVKIIFGAHATMEPDYVLRCIECLTHHPTAGCVGGIIHNTYQNQTSQAIGIAMSSPFGVGGAHFRTGNTEGYVDTVAFGAYRKAVFDKIGYFDEELVRNQDDELNYRVIHAGYTIFLTKNINSNYVVRASFKKLWRQYYQYGYWKVYVNKKHRVITTLRQLIPFGLVSFLLLVSLGSFLFNKLIFLLIATLLIYGAGAVIFACAKTNEMKLLPKVIWSFFILHFSYGAGYLIAIVQFFILRKKPNALNKQLSR